MEETKVLSFDVPTDVISDNSSSSEEPQITFEGPEKVLEIWFVPPDQWEDDEVGNSSDIKPDSNESNINRRYLLTVPQNEWEEMLELVHCQILSKISNDKADAYLLSESSMFVYEYQVVIKTCGTTTLLNCLEKLLTIAASVGLTKVDDVFYNRQNFFFPEKQLHPHQGFKAECRVLDSYFNNGGAYIVGKLNENHYNFYNAESKMNRCDPIMLEKDNTIEILMTGLDPQKMKLFYYQDGADNKCNKEIRDISGISDFFPNAIIDDYMFEPFGYSLNALMDNGYYTIHITPQPNCSFVSFETNVSLDDYTELILKVLRAFGPERFIIAHFANSLASEHLKNNNLHKGFDDNLIQNETDFKIVDDIYCRFEHYDLFFQQYNKNHLKKNNNVPTIKNKRRQDADGSILKANSPVMKSKADKKVNVDILSLIE